jgi:hypothetical protein
MVIAAASTARPISCPPISLGSKGSDEAVVVAFVILGLDRCCVPGVADGEGVTTGKRLVMLPGVTVVPGKPGTVVGSAGTVITGAGDEPCWPTTRAMLASAGDSALPLAVAVPWTLTVTVNCSPTETVLAILSVISSSKAWYAGKEPT